jgi:hypothetical protein
MKYSIAAVTCAAALVAGLTACGAGDDNSPPASQTGRPSPSTTAASQPATTLTTPAKSGPAVLVAHSTNTHGGLKLIVNLPSDIPSGSRASMRLLSDFLQADGRTTATNKLDPAISGMASADVVKYLKSTTGGESVQGVGSMTYTISTVHTVAGRTTVVTGCLDQSKLAQVRKDGSQFFDAAARDFPTLKMSAAIKHGMAGPKVNSFSFSAGPC